MAAVRMNTFDMDLIDEAFPKSPEGEPLCCHCGGRRPGYLTALHPVLEQAFEVRAGDDPRRSRTEEKARIVLAARPVMP